MQVAVAQLPIDDAAVDTNLTRVLSTLDTLRPGTDLVVFPETMLSGFPTPENRAVVSQPIDGPAIRAIAQAARTRDVSVAIGFAEHDDGRFYNASVLLTPNGLALHYRKTHLWASDVGVFDGGTFLATAPWHGLRVGLLICYDIEFPEGARTLASLGADLLIVTNGNMDPYGPVHRRAIAARAMENQVFAVMANRCGTSTDGTRFPGESAIVDPFGEVVAQAGSEPDILYATLDLSRLAASRAHYRYLDDRRIAHHGREAAAAELTYPHERRWLIA